MRMPISPDKTDPPLVVDTDRMLAMSVLRQRLEPVAGRHSKIIERPRIVNETALSERHGLNIRRKLSAQPTFPDRCCLGIAKARDHDRAITQNVMRYKAM